MANEEVSGQGVVYGRIREWYRELRERGLSPSWLIEGVLFKVNVPEPIKIGKTRYSRNLTYTLLGNYLFVRTYHIRIPFTTTGT
jgi:hypothetical protein